MQNIGHHTVPKEQHPGNTHGDVEDKFDQKSDNYWSGEVPGFLHLFLKVRERWVSSKREQELPETQEPWFRSYLEVAMIFVSSSDFFMFNGIEDLNWKLRKRDQY